MEYVKSGTIATKGEVAGMAHKEYVDSFNNNYDPNFQTKYFDLTTDDEGNFVAGIRSKTDLPAKYSEKVMVSQSDCVADVILELAEAKAEAVEAPNEEPIEEEKI